MGTQGIRLNPLKEWWLKIDWPSNPSHQLGFRVEFQSYKGTELPGRVSRLMIQWINKVEVYSQVQGQERDE